MLIVGHTIRFVVKSAEIEMVWNMDLKWEGIKLLRNQIMFFWKDVRIGARIAIDAVNRPGNGHTWWMHGACTGHNCRRGRAEGPPFERDCSCTSTRCRRLTGLTISFSFQMAHVEYGFKGERTRGPEASAAGQPGARPLPAGEGAPEPEKRTSSAHTARRRYRRILINAGPSVAHPAHW